MADLWWKGENIRERARITAEVDFGWREVEELQPSRSLQETTQPLTYLKIIKMVGNIVVHVIVSKYDGLSENNECLCHYCDDDDKVYLSSK